MSTMNPHAPRRAVEDASPPGFAGEAVRREHLGREASMQALGLLYYVLGGTVLLGTIYALATGSDSGLEIRPGVWGTIDLSVYGGSVVTMFAVGSGVRGLRRWARVGAIIVCSIGLLRIPVGTLICPYFLYLLLSVKGRRLFAPDYAAIIEATPQLKYPRIVVVSTVLAVLAIVAALYALRFAIRG